MLCNIRLPFRLLHFRFALEYVTNVDCIISSWNLKGNSCSLWFFSIITPCLVSLFFMRLAIKTNKSLVVQLWSVTELVIYTIIAYFLLQHSCYRWVAKSELQVTIDAVALTTELRPVSLDLYFGLGSSFSVFVVGLACWVFCIFCWLCVSFSVPVQHRLFAKAEIPCCVLSGMLSTLLTD